MKDLGVSECSLNLTEVSSALVTHASRYRHERATARSDARAPTWRWGARTDDAGA